MKIISAVVIATIAIASLSGCTTQSSGSTNCTPLAQSGSAVDSVKVTGKFGTLPTAEFKSPLKADKTERKILSEGEGNIAYAGSSVGYEMTLYRAKTGESLGQTSYDGTQLQTSVLNTDTMVGGLVSAIECAPAGSQIVAVLSPTDLLDANGVPVANLAKDESVVAVIDLVSVSLQKANGKAQKAPPGMPEVTLDKNGVPTVTVPKSEAPSKLEIAVLQKGDGAVVEPHSTVTVHYTGVLWSDGSTFDSSWTSGTPATFNLDGVVPGFSQALEGQTVGSQILAVLPPDLAYGDSDKAGIPANSTLIFVIDILSTIPPQ